MNYQIRELHTLEEMLSCYDLIKELYNWLSAEKYQLRLEAMIPNHYFQIAVFDGDQCVGLSGIWIGTKIYSSKYLEMDNVVVDEKYRSKGIGKLLVDAAEAKAKAEGCRTMMLDAYVENHAAHKFYFREGFVVKGFHFLKKLS